MGHFGTPSIFFNNLSGNKKKQRLNKSFLFPDKYHKNEH